MSVSILYGDKGNRRERRKKLLLVGFRWNFDGNDQRVDNIIYHVDIYRCAYE